MNFDEIYLSPEELELLQILSDRSVIVVENSNRAVLMRLQELEFVSIFALSDPVSIRTASKVSDDLIKKGAAITERGLSYLHYIKGRNREKRFEKKQRFRRDLFMVALGAFLSHLPDLVVIFKGLVNGR